MSEQPTVVMPDGTRLPALWERPAEARACLVLAHGAGGGMESRPMAAAAAGFLARGVAVFRFAFPFSVAGSRRPDPPAVAQAAVREAVATASRLAPDLPLFAGGRSFGGRMTSGAQATEPLRSVRGLVMLAFPLHGEGKPAAVRADHLTAVTVPMLFLSGSRDPLAEIDLLRPTVAALGGRATLAVAEGADHGFRVRGAPRGQGDALPGLLDAAASWIARF